MPSFSVSPSDNQPTIAERVCMHEALANEESFLGK